MLLSDYGLYDYPLFRLREFAQSHYGARRLAQVHALSGEGAHPLLVIVPNMPPLTPAFSPFAMAATMHALYIVMATFLWMKSKWFYSPKTILV
jgi:hypothetical protein